MNELISVIVPVYKVEDYLARCVDSILEQTYANLEIILVNDGSPDDCGAICDAYAEKDSRIQVIHKKNGGLSDARNVAIDVAQGAYIAFIDSDDYVTADYIENLYSTLKENDAEISVTGIRKVFDTENSQPQEPEITETYAYNTKEAVLELLTMGKISQEAWAKLYKAELFRDIRFPVGELFEDLAIMYQLFLRAERIACSNKPQYQYFIREGSIMQSPFNMRQYVEVRWIEEATALVSRKYPELDHEIRGRRVWSYFKTLYRILCSKDRKEYLLQQDEMIRKIRSDAHGLLRSPRIGLNLKIKIASLYVGRWGFYSVQKVSDTLKQIKSGRKYTV